MPAEVKIDAEMLCMMKGCAQGGIGVLVSGLQRSINGGNDCNTANLMVQTF